MKEQTAELEIRENKAKKFYWRFKIAGDVLAVSTDQYATISEAEANANRVLMMAWQPFGVKSAHSLLAGNDEPMTILGYRQRLPWWCRLVRALFVRKTA